MVPWCQKINGNSNKHLVALRDFFIFPFGLKSFLNANAVQQIMKCYTDELCKTKCDKSNALWKWSSKKNKNEHTYKHIKPWKQSEKKNI